MPYHHVSNACSSRTEEHWPSILARKSMLNSIFDVLFKKKEKRGTISNCIIIITGNRRYFWDHVQSTLAGGLQYLSPLIIVSTPNEQR